MKRDEEAKALMRQRGSAQQIGLRGCRTLDVGFQIMVVKVGKVL